MRKLGHRDHDGCSFLTAFLASYPVISRIYTATTSAIHFRLSCGPSCIVNLCEHYSSRSVIRSITDWTIDSIIIASGGPTTSNAEKTKVLFPALTSSARVPNISLADRKGVERATVSNVLNFHLLPLQSFVVDNLLHRIEPGLYPSTRPRPSVSWRDTLAKGAAVRGIR